MKERTVVVVGWKPGLQKVSFNDLLRETTGMGLREAKAVVVRILNGDEVELRALDDERGVLLARRAAELGAVLRSPRDSVK
jgi:hypothetical protein